MSVIAIEEHWNFPALTLAVKALPEDRADPSTVLDEMGDNLERLDDIDDLRIATMDEQGIDMQILSLAPPGAQPLDAGEAIALSRQANDLAARACLLTVGGGWGQAGGMSRTRSLSDVAWARIEPLMPIASARGGRPFRDHRRVVEGIIWRYRTGSPWRDLPAEFGPWQTAWKRHRRFSGDGTWDTIHAELLADADAGGEIDWAVSVDSTVNRAHQHATNLPRDTGGSVELQESAGRAR